MDRITYFSASLIVVHFRELFPLETDSLKFSPSAEVNYSF